LSRPSHDTPYRDDVAPYAAPARETSSSHTARAPHSRRPAHPANATPASKHAPKQAAAHGPQQATKHAATHPAKHAAKRGAKPAAKAATKVDIKPAPKPAPKHTPKRPVQHTLTKAVGAHVTHAAAARGITPAAPATPPGRRRSARRGRRAGSAAPAVHLTSHPTGRTAYVETRAWLLAQHGPVCAYCGRRFTAAVMTLDHVAPRRGQTAYDRRDNLVLACPGCNAAKRDLAPLAFLLGSRIRAANLLRYGAHLSPMLIDLARSLAPAGTLPPPADVVSDAVDWAALDDGDDSPYRD
jgi:5-methylcytosine-specific restriction endonuclease McrA